MFILNPLDDGKTHINIYSRGRTRLGRLASNHSNIPIYHPVHGNFSSAESYWYWLSTGKKHDELRVLQPRQARFIGKQIQEREGRIEIPNFRELFADGLLVKLQGSAELQELLEESDLPFAHYYFFGKPEACKVVEPVGHEWQMRLWEFWRASLKADEPLIVPTHLL